jgi:hypothetical protein
MNPPFHPPSVCPSANLSPFHLPHTETRQWGPHPSSVFMTFLPPLGHSFYTGAPVSVFCTFFPRMYFLYKPLYLPVIYLRRHHRRPAFLLATCNPCHPWLEHCFSFILTGIVYIFRVLPRSLILYPLNLLTLSRLWHNLPRILSYPNGCGHALSHASSNQGQSRVIPLCDFVSVPLPPHHISRFHGVP